MNRIANLDKTIKELTNRLDEVHPYSNSFVNHQNRNDGIHYWRGKKIISTQIWNELFEKSSTYSDTYKTILTSRRPLQYFPDDYISPISFVELKDEKLKEEIQKWNIEYYELLEYRNNSTLGRMKCSKCVLSGSNDDPIFIGIEKVFSRIIINQCNNNAFNTQSQRIITYHCNVLNIFSCPFKSKEFCKDIDEKEETSNLPYKREDLFLLHQISFAIEQALSTFFVITRDNEIIFEVDFVNDRVHEIHTKYNGEPESWGWHENINEQLSKVKPISNIVIKDDQDIYNILTSREKLECLLQEYEKDYQLDIESEEESENEINNGNKPILTIQQKEEFKKQKKEELILLKDNKQKIIDFIIDNKDSIRIEDLKSYEPVYKCYKAKGHCFYCNTITNIICKNCYNYNSHNNKEVWLCTNHWEEHVLEHH